MLELDASLRALVLRHEREHCLARDPWLLLASSVAVALCPWNAALWIFARRLRLALEIDCDARVLASGAEPARYGQLLFWIAQHPGGMMLAPMLVAGQSHLERRIIAMRSRLARPRAARLCLACGILAAAIVAACSEGSPNGPIAGSNPATRPSDVAASVDRAAHAVNAAGPYFEFQVERQAQQSPRTGTLRYPADMRLANREGEVLAQFVVRETGAVDMATFKAIRSTDRAFTTAVANALPTMRFIPAEVGGRKVPQLVQQPFTFSLSRN
jgi:TonB family protein